MEKPSAPAMSFEAAIEAAKPCCSEQKADIFFYNGTITRSNVLQVMEEIYKGKSCNHLYMILVTFGGDPHAAFKICRYIQEKYDKFTLFVPGFCKSAGTLFAIAASEVVFAPFGELGPLDVQMAKPDHFQFDSGLVIGESLETLERRAAQTFKRMFDEVMMEQQGLDSINSALDAASELTKAIYQPIMGRIDPEEIGMRQRAARITVDYGRRLATRSLNADARAVSMLAEKYSSHSFVIDKTEARELFKKVRDATPTEMKLAHSLGGYGRVERLGNLPAIFTVLGRYEGTSSGEAQPLGESNGPSKRKRGATAPSRASRRTNGPTVPQTDKQNRGRSGGVRARNRGNGREPASA